MSAPVGTSLAQIDADHVWHPYGALPAAVPSLIVHSADGVHLETASSMG